VLIGLFIYFSASISEIQAGLGAAVIIPYSIENTRRCEIFLPNWIHGLFFEVVLAKCGKYRIFGKNPTIRVFSRGGPMADEGLWPASLRV
jgi:hypothetical protein